MFACVVRFFKLQVFKLQMFKTPTVREERSKGALKVADTAGEAGPVSTREMMGARGLHPEGVWPKSGARKGPSLKSSTRVERGPRSEGAGPWDRTEGRGPPTLNRSNFLSILLSVLLFCFLFLFVSFNNKVIYLFIYLFIY